MTQAPQEARAGEYRTEVHLPQELQDLLRCGRTFCYGLLARGEIPSYKVGKLRRIDLADVERWLEANRYPASR